MAKTVKQSAKTAPGLKAPRGRPRPKLVIKPVSIPLAQATDETPSLANPSHSKDPDPPCPVSSVPSMATNTSGSMQAPNPAAEKSFSASTHAPNPAPTKKSTTSAPATTALSPEDLAAQLTAALAKIDRLEKRESATKSKELLEVKRPVKRITDLQQAMGLEDQRGLYISCRSTVRDVMAMAGIEADKVWRKQEPLALAKVISVAKSRNPQLGRYEHGWATLEIMRTFNKNRRNYRKKVGRLTEEDDGMQEDDEMQKGSDEEEFSDSNDEGTSSAGKRTKAVQGGTKKKARMDR